MSAKLVITEGDLVGKEIPIQFSVLRIGSGASCEVQVRGIADVAATLRYDQGHYQLLNRGTTPIHLDGDAIDPQKSKAWLHQGQLRLSDQCVLSLEIDGDPAPRNFGSLSRDIIDQIKAPEPVENEPEEDEDALSEPVPKAKADPKKAFQMTVIALCVIGGAYIQYSDMQKANGGGGASSTGAVTKPMLREKFGLLVDELISMEKKDPHFRFGLLREALQQGRIADLDEDWNASAFHYRAVLAQMEDLEFSTRIEPETEDASTPSKPATSSLRVKADDYRKLPLDSRLNEFVRQRLTQIDPKVSKFTDPDA